MSLTFERVLETADTATVLANEAGALLAKIDRFLAYNSDQAIDWNGDPLPSYITEDADGNLNGRRFSRADVSNVVFSLEQISKVLTNQTITQGDHLGNLNKLSQPMPIR